MTSESNPGFAQRLRETRVAAGLSQVQLAGDVLSASYVSLLEAGQRRPTQRVMEVLAERLSVPVEQLRDGVDPRARQELGLRLRYAELALQNGEAEEALTAFRALEDPVSRAAGVRHVCARRLPYTAVAPPAAAWRPRMEVSVLSAA